jgi:hypothetical protein
MSPGEPRHGHGFIPRHAHAGVNRGTGPRRRSRKGPPTTPSAYPAGIWQEAFRRADLGRASCPPLTRSRWIAGAVAMACPSTVRWMQCWTSPSSSVDRRAVLKRTLPPGADFSTAWQVSRPRSGVVDPPSGQSRPPLSRTGRSTTVHRFHTMMMMMTSIEEWGKIHIPNDAAFAGAGNPCATEPSCPMNPGSIPPMEWT